jgi:hypothetical protein
MLGNVPRLCAVDAHQERADTAGAAPHVTT